MMKERFTDKVVWITGGGSGLGRALALELARRGAVLALSGRREDKLDLVCEEVRALGARAIPVVCDVANEDAVRAAVESIVGELWRIDVAIANAGFSVAGRIEDLSAQEWRRQLDVNVVGLANTAKFAIPELKKTGGRLVLIGSVASMVTTPGVGAYHASKYAVRAIGQTLAMELHGSGVSVTTIHPGLVESDIARVDNKGRFREEFEDRRPDTFMWKADDAARVMLRAISRRRREFTFTGHGRLAAFLGRHAPGLVHFLTTRIGTGYKPAKDEHP